MYKQGHQNEPKLFFSHIKLLHIYLCFCLWKCIIWEFNMLLTNYSYNAQKYITAWFKNQSEAGAKKDGLNRWVLLIKRGAAFSTCLSSFCWRILVGDGGLSSSTLKHKNTSMINTLSRINRSLHFFLSFSAWS